MQATFVPTDPNYQIPPMLKKAYQDYNANLQQVMGNQSLTITNIVEQFAQQHGVDNTIKILEEALNVIKAKRLPIGGQNVK